MPNLWYWLLELLGVTRKPRPIVSGKTQGWYGRVNSWSCGKKFVLRRDLDLCKKYGVDGYHIELVGWTDFDKDPASYRSQKYYKTVRNRYKWLVKACRARGLWLFVSVVNDNAGKHGEANNPRLEQQQDNVRFAFEQVFKNGPRNVIVQPVAEIQTGYGSKLNHQMTAELVSAGFQTVYNGAGRASAPGDGSHWYAVHPAHVTDTYKPPAFVVSDHSLIIRELNKGNTLDGMGNPGAIKWWRYRCIMAGNPVVCFYHYAYDGGKGSDKKAIRAMGE